MSMCEVRTKKAYLFGTFMHLLKVMYDYGGISERSPGEKSGNYIEHMLSVKMCPRKKMKKYMLSVSSEERHFWSLVVSLMNNTSHHTKDTPVIAQKIYQKTRSCSSQDFLQNVKFPWLQSISKNPHKEKHLFDAKLLILSPLPAA